MNPPRLALLELWSAEEGRLLQAVDVHAWPLTLGRALDNTVVLHDPALPAHALRIAPDASSGELLLETLDAPLQLGLGSAPADAATALAPHSRSRLAPLMPWRLGGLHARLRLLADPLPEPLFAPRPPAPTPALPAAQAGAAAVAAAESAATAAAPLGPARSRRGWAGLVLAALAFAVAGLWVAQSPEADWQDYLLPLLSMIGGIAIWAGGWALLTKLFANRFVWLPHLWLALAFWLGLGLLDLLLGVLAYSLDLPLLSRLRALATAVGAAALLAQHLRIALPGHARRIYAVIGLMLLAGLGLHAANQWQRDGDLFTELYSSTLPPPWLRLASPKPPGELLERLRRLEAPLQDAARKAAQRDGEV